MAKDVTTTAKVVNQSIKEEGSILKQPKSVWAVFFASIIAFMGLGLADPILPITIRPTVENDQTFL